MHLIAIINYYTFYYFGICFQAHYYVIHAETVAVILQARTGSSRLPRKVLADIAGGQCLSWSA